MFGAWGDYSGGVQINSLFFVRYWIFIIHYSLFIIHYSLFIYFLATKARRHEGTKARSFQRLNVFCFF
ncbi:MAG: hypothetical protein EOO50_06810 [Flavobacterium sp.]|nr:MAG: hypothetical protein EOO50_06810 [Flavobacterium sp.]